MKAVKLTPYRKEHVVGIPFRVDVDDVFIDIDDATTVKAWVGYQANGSSANLTPSPDLPGDALFLIGPWIEVAEVIRHITPTVPGIYTVVVEAYVNIASPPVPPKIKRVIYRGVPVIVGPNS